MRSDRRDFLKQLGCLATFGATAATATPALASADAAAGHAAGPADPMGVLVDLTECIGCRLCEFACKAANDINPGPLESYDDPSVFAQKRRPEPQAFTVVNSWPVSNAPGAKPVYAKINCMHCNHAACVSACIVGALTKQDNGAVIYDAWKCIGCRYCMIACPFQLPAYSYDNVLTPEVRKCQFCNHRLVEGKLPGCVEACPRQVLTFGKRKELVTLAHQKIHDHPARYEPHVYGEHEIGGTSWMYLSPAPITQVGFLALGKAAPPKLTEDIQHGVFKYWIAPVGWYGFLATAMWWTGRRAKVNAASAHGDANEGRPHAALPPSRTNARRLSPAAAGQSDESPAEESWQTGHAAYGEVHGTAESSVAVLDPPATGTLDISLPSHSSAHPDDDADDNTDHDALDTHKPVAHAHDDHPHAAPVNHKLLTPGVWALIILVLTGVGFGLYRFFFGLAASTNLDQQHPWGLWIAMDVGSGIALAGGGFVTAALVHIFHREHYHAVARSALLTAMLGYTFYVPGLLADIGRWYNIWHPLIPNMWQGNSVLFEVGLCVMIYLNVQYAEMVPIVCERLMGQHNRFPRIARLAKTSHGLFEKMMPALLVLGVCLSTFHQSSLGNLMVIAPYKLHHLWWSPVAPIHFLLSAMMVGFPMVIFTMLFASWCLNRKPEMHVLAPLARYVPAFLALYLAVKIGDIIARKMHLVLLDGSLQSCSWLVEVILGVIVPMLLLLIPAVRRSPRWLAAACLTVILGVVLNRLNVFVVGYHPPYATKSYFPSITEFAVSIGLVAALLLTYRVAVTYLPILEPRQQEAA